MILHLGLRSSKANIVITAVIAASSMAVDSPYARNIWDNLFTKRSATLPEGTRKMFLFPTAGGRDPVHLLRD